MENLSKQDERGGRTQRERQHRLPLTPRLRNPSVLWPETSWPKGANGLGPDLVSNGALGRGGVCFFLF